jgi:hypothetical protein
MVVFGDTGFSFDSGEYVHFNLGHGRCHDASFEICYIWHRKWWPSTAKFPGPVSVEYIGASEKRKYLDYMANDRDLNASPLFVEKERIEDIVGLLSQHTRSPRLWMTCIGRL